MLKNINAIVLRVYTYNIYRARNIYKVRCARWGGTLIIINCSLIISSILQTAISRTLGATRPNLGAARPNLGATRPRVGISMLGLEAPTWKCIK